MMDITSYLLGKKSSGGGSSAEYEEGTFTPTEDTQNPSIPFVNAHSTTPSVFVLVETSEEPVDINGVYYFLFIDYEHLTNYHTRAQATSSQTNYYSYLLTNFQKTATSTSSISQPFAFSYTNTHDEEKRYPRYFIKETGATPRVDINPTNPNVTYLANHSYKWYAIWK